MVGTLYTESRVTDILDKKSGALIILDCRFLSLSPSLINIIYLLHTHLHVAETKTERGEVIAINQFIVFIIGAGGFGGKRQSSALKVSKSLFFFYFWCSI